MRYSVIALLWAVGCGADLGATYCPGSQPGDIEFDTNAQGVTRMHCRCRDGWFYFQIAPPVTTAEHVRAEFSKACQ